MSEQEIIENAKRIIEVKNNTIHCSNELYDFYLTIQGLLDLYNKEKEKNKELDYTLKQTQNSWYTDTKIIEEMKQNYIAKDTIEEKLKKVKDKILVLTDEQGYWGDTKLLNEEAFLEELLEGDNNENR